VLAVLLTSCGFKSEPSLLEALLNKSNSECANLYITDSYAHSANNNIATRRIYKIQSFDVSSLEKNKYPIYQSFINNSNIVSNISANKSIKNKACKDYYASNIEYFE
jgi:hypothetical protein